MKKLLIILPLLFTLQCAVSNYLKIKADLNVKYDEGAKLFKHSKYTDALSHFQSVKQIDPDFLDTNRYIFRIEETIKVNTKKYYDKGKALDDKKTNLTDAIINYRTCISYSPDGKYLNAIERIEALLKDTKVQEFISHQFKTIKDFKDKKKYNEARVLVLKVLEIDPKNPEGIKQKSEINGTLISQADPIFTQGEEQFKKENYAAAAGFYQKVLSIYPDYEKATSQLNLASQYAYNSRYYQSAVNAQKASKDLECVKHANNIRGNYKNSAQVLNQCKSSVEANYSKYFGDAVALYESQKLKESLEIFNILLIVSSNDDQAKKYKELTEKKISTLESLNSE